MIPRRAGARGRRTRRVTVPAPVVHAKQNSPRRRGLVEWRRRESKSVGARGPATLCAAGALRRPRPADTTGGVERLLGGVVGGGRRSGAAGGAVSPSPARPRRPPRRSGGRVQRHPLSSESSPTSCSPSSTSGGTSPHAAPGSFDAAAQGRTGLRSRRGSATPPRLRHRNLRARPVSVTCVTPAPRSLRPRRAAGHGRARDARFTRRGCPGATARTGTPRSSRSHR